LIEKLKQHAAGLKKELFALYLAARDPRVPWYVRAFMALVLAYAFSPIDLIPDFIPVLGYLDDLVIIPLGIVLALKMIPAQVMAEARERAREMAQPDKPVSLAGAAIVIVAWLGIIALAVWLVVYLRSR
jgi:uncharacterized membrane protein YkvA (DUF1232 family)